MGLDRAARLEAVLFVSQEPASLADLARALEAPPVEVEGALEDLATRLEGRGLALQRQGQRFQLVTRPEAAGDVQRYLDLELGSRLSQAALETLALIAYKQPVTRQALEAIRGVSCDSVLRSLQARGLIEEVDRLEQAGRPIRYGTTFQFLQHFGLASLADLPPLPGPDEGSAQAESTDELP